MNRIIDDLRVQARAGDKGVALVLRADYERAHTPFSHRVGERADSWRGTLRADY